MRTVSVDVSQKSGLHIPHTTFGVVLITISGPATTGFLGNHLWWGGWRSLVSLKIVIKTQAESTAGLYPRPQT